MGGAGLGTSIEVLGNADISFGVNGTKTTTKYNVSFIDVNGDGLPDKITRSGEKFTIMLNTGSGFIPYSEEQQGRFNESLATSVSQYGNFAVTIPIHILFLKYCCPVKLFQTK